MNAFFDSGEEAEGYVEDSSPPPKDFVSEINKLFDQYKCNSIK